MRSRLLPRVLAGLLVAGSLAACIPGGGTAPLPGLLSASPNPVVMDLPEEGSATGEKTITLRNLGPGVTADIKVLSSSSQQGGEGLEFTSIVDDCALVSLAVNETCQVFVSVTGDEPSGPYEIFVRFSSDNTNTVTVPIVLV